VAADTVVGLPPTSDGGAWRLLGKPLDAGDARAMLVSLSGSRHSVVTGVAVARMRPAEAQADVRVEVETTVVAMRAIAPAEVEAYVASGEWRDKAGGYAIQESADRFVTALEGGGFDNVVGLPVARTLRLLESMGFAGPVAGDPGNG
jgi:septum formation protein